MNEKLCHVLKQLIVEYGTSIGEDPRRLKALLNDLCGGHRREINGLAVAAEESVPSALLNRNSPLPREAVKAQQEKRLTEIGLAAELAHWSVETWAWALTGEVALSPAVITQAPVVAAGSALTLGLAPNVKMEFVRVPAGEFVMGSNDGDNEANADEKPLHRVWLGDFLIGKYPVTNVQYAIYAKVIKAKWGMPNDKLNHPAVNVAWDDAVGFCEWVEVVTGQKLRLPTEAEWEKAARGADGRIYPWGNKPPDKTLANYGKHEKGTTPVGKYSPQGDSPFGVADMAGNVREWVADWYDEKHYASSLANNPVGPSSGMFRILRGGSWYDSPWDLRVSLRSRYGPGYWCYYKGFRCAQ